MSDNESDGLIDIADLDPRIMPMFKTSPERIGLAIGDELEDWNSEFHDCDEVTWYSGEPPVQVSIGYVRADLYESMQSQLAAANERADAAVKALDMLHVAVCQAVVILNKSHATSMFDAYRILREALVAHADAAPVPAQPAFADNGDDIEARMAHDAENACPACGGSGHVDDVSEAFRKATQPASLSETFIKDVGNES